MRTLLTTRYEPSRYSFSHTRHRHRNQGIFPDNTRTEKKTHHTGSISKARNTNNTWEKKIIKELRGKPIYYLKVDKGNALVILDKEDCENRMKDKLQNGPSRRLRIGPLQQLIKQMNKFIKKRQSILGTHRLLWPITAGFEYSTNGEVS